MKPGKLTVCSRAADIALVGKESRLLVPGIKFTSDLVTGVLVVAVLV